MNLKEVNWGKVLFWGGATGAMYFCLFYFSEKILGFAYQTPDACIVGEGAEATSFNRISAADCQTKGGQFVAGHWYYALVPISIAFAISYAHGIFTGLFWDIMGLKPASNNKKK